MANKSFETKQGPKQQVRDLLVKHTDSPKNILTLPGRKMLCAKTFKKAWPKATILGIEDNLESWKIISEEMFCYNSSIRAYLELQRLKTSHLDLVFLDYFSYLNSSTEEDIIALLRNHHLLHHGKSAIVGITLMKAMRSEAKETLAKMQKTIFDGERRERCNTLKDVGTYLTHFMIHRTIDFPISFELLDSVEYTAAENSTPMYFFCFKVNK